MVKIPLQATFAVKTVQQLSKKDYAITLLEKNKPVKFIQDQLKITFGTGMSNRDLTSLRKLVHENMLFPSLDNYKQATLDLYESTLGLQKILINLNTISQLPKGLMEIYDAISSDILKYRDFYHATRAKLILKDLPPEIRTPKVIQSIMESLDDLKRGDFVSPEDL